MGESLLNGDFGVEGDVELDSFGKACGRVSPQRIEEHLSHSFCFITPYLHSPHGRADSSIDIASCLRLEAFPGR
jgi:hypothetical protein